MHSSPSIGILMPTRQGAHHLPYSLPPLLASPLHPRVLVIDSSSTDGTPHLARTLGAEVIVIPLEEFNHGTTRERGRRYLNTEIIIMITQDAYVASPHTLVQLVEPLLREQASIAYARQLPHVGASPLAVFARTFNYPDYSHIRRWRDFSIYGTYTFFCSNACAAYCSAALDEIGGFPATPFGEDAIVTAQLLRRHHAIAYVSEAHVYHSHDYTLREEFQRHFLMALGREPYRKLLGTGKEESKRGKTYLKELLLTLSKSAPFLIPYALLQTAVKWLGYRLGQIVAKHFTRSST